MLCSANYSVRLACLKHAASVRPEPGSNSNSIFVYDSKSSNIQFDLHRTLWCFGSITLSKLTFRLFLYILFNCHCSCCPLLVSDIILSQLLSHCQHFFKNFLPFFIFFIPFTRHTKTRCGNRYFCLSYFYTFTNIF